MNQIHHSAELGTGTTVGYYSIISENAKIGKDCVIGHHVVIHPDVIIGNGVRIDDHVVIGKLPMRSALSVMTLEKELPETTIRDQCIIGTSVILYRGCKLGKKVMVADFASIREEVEIGDVSTIGRGVTVENQVTIGKKSKIQTEAYITALSEIGDYCFIAPSVTFTNDNFMGRSEERFKHHKGVTVKKGGRVGANATVLPGIVIGEDGMVGAGAIVTKDVLDKQLVYGTPAQTVSAVPEDQLLENQCFYKPEE
jgi:UDP-2-acetamido-3-amino-2,3-dideoxy-glucuronate N-acetyltransferase